MQPRRCQARHERYPGWRCELYNTETTRHGGDHAYTDSNGVTIHWADMVAMYPVFGDAGLDQVGGEHYKKFKIQPWDVIDEYGLDFYSGNALKYLLRAGNKGPALEDLKKCRHYLDKIIERMEE